METFRMERVGRITGTLFFMEVVVLDKGFYPVLLHEPVIFFRAVTGVCHTDTRQAVIAVPEGVGERDQGQRIGGVGKQPEVYDELVFSTCL